MRTSLRPSVVVLALGCAYLALVQWRAKPQGQDLFTLLVAGAFGVAAMVIHRQYVFTRRNRKGVEHYNACAFAEAERVFEANALRYRYPALVHGVSVYNLALTRLRLGRIDNALKLFTAVERDPGLRRAPVVNAGCPCWIAVCFALRGELDAARYWLAEAETSGRCASSLVLFARLIVLCRAGFFEQALTLVDDHGRAIVETAQAEISVPIALVRSYALEELGRRESVRSAAEEWPRLDLHPSAYVYLGSSWSSFRSFLKERGLSDI